MKYTVAVLGILAVLYLVWGSLNLEAARGLPEGVIEGCEDGAVGFLAAKKGNGGIVYYLAKVTQPSKWDDIVCGLSLGQLVQAKSTGKEL